MRPQTKNSSATSDREIIATRLFDAPRELVFEMWTKQEHVAKWWGPNGFSLTIHEMEVKPGGHWRFIMHGPDGTDYKNHIVFVEIVRPERIVYNHVPEPPDPVNFETTVTFENVAGKTRLTMRALFPSAKALEYVVTKYGAIEGMHQHLGRLEALLSDLRKDEL